MDYSLRPAKTEDTEVIRDLSVRLSEKEAEQFDTTIDPQWNETKEAMEYITERVEGHGFAYVAESDGEVIGYALGATRDSEEYREDLILAELETMFVESEHRSQGIGTGFIEKFKEWAQDQNADRLRVEVTSQNEKGLAFYTKNGFREYAEIMEQDI